MTFRWLLAMALGGVLAAIAPPSMAADLIVSGRLEDLAARPLAGARVELTAVPPNHEMQRLLLAGRTGPEPLAVATTDAAGRYELAAPETGVFKVVVRRDGCMPVQLAPVPLVEPTELPPVQMRPAAPASVEVVSPEGAPVAGAWVYVVPAASSDRAAAAANEWRTASRFGRTDAGGRFTFPRGEDERVEVSVFRPGDTVPRHFDAPGRLTLPPVEGPAVTIAVRNPDGTPAEGVVAATGELAWPVGTTDAAGRLRLTVPPSPRLALQLLAADGRRRDVHLDAAAFDATYVLPETGRVVGRVVHEETATPLAGALVWAAHDPGTFVKTRAAGDYVLVAPSGRSWWLQAEAPGFQARSARVLDAVATTSRAPILSLSPALTVQGRVVDRARKPVAGAVVVPAGHAQGGTRAPAVLTDPAGRFRLSRLPGPKVDLEVRKAGFAPRVLRGIQASPQRGPVDLGTLLLDRGARIEGLVTDAEGRPLRDVEVWATAGAAARSLAAALDRLSKRPPGAVTSSLGRFDLEDLPPGEDVHLYVRGDGYLPAEVPGVSAPTAGPVRLVLQPGAWVRGTVVDPQGQPVPGASISIRPQDAPAGVARPVPIRGSSAESDQEGRFLLADLAPGAYDLRVAAEGFLPSVLPVSVTSSLDDLQVVVERGATLTGRIAGEGDRPVPGARVLVGDAAGVSDEDGLYRVEGAPLGRQTVEVRHREYGRMTREARITPGASRLDLTFTEGNRVAGRVVDEIGSPVPSATVLLAAASPAGGEREAFSGPDGAFSFPHVPDGRFTLEARKTGFVRGNLPEGLTVAGAAVESLEVVISHGAAITGRLRGLAAGELGQAGVVAENAEGESRRGEVDFTGHYEIPGLAPGEWTVRATLRGGSRQVQAFVLLRPGAQRAEVDLEFRGGLSLAGRVSFAGAPLGGAQVSLAGQDLPAERLVSTRYDGRFQIEDLQPGMYRLEIFHPGEMLSVAQNLHLARDEDLPIKIAAARVSGRVLSSGGSEPVADALIVFQRLVDGEEGAVTTLGTGPGGEFTFARMAEGRYRVTVQKDGYVPAVQDVEVHAGGDLEHLRFELPSSGKAE